MLGKRANPDTPVVKVADLIAARKRKALEEAQGIIHEEPKKEEIEVPEQEVEISEEEVAEESSSEVSQEPALI